MSDENEPHAADPLAEHDRPWHTHNAWDNHGMTNEQLTDPTWRAQVDAMLAGALERAQQPARADDPAELQQRLDELEQRICRHRADADTVIAEHWALRTTNNADGAGS